MTVLKDEVTNSIILSNLDLKENTRNFTTLLNERLSHRDLYPFMFMMDKVGDIRIKGPEMFTLRKVIHLKLPPL